MKKLLFTLIVLLFAEQLFAQNYKFGKLSKEELEEKFYPLDSTADAAVLYKKRRTYFDFDHSGPVLITDIHYRIKIYNTDGFEWATEEIRLGVGRSDEEKVGAIKASTYNLVDGKIEVTKLDKKEIFKEKRSKYLNIEKFTMPNLKEGCIVEWKYQIRSPFYSSIDDVVLQYTIPVKRYEGKIELLEYFYFNRRTKGYFPFKIKESSKRNTTYDTNDTYYTINVSNIPALKEEDYVSNIDNYRAGIVFEVGSIAIPGRVYESYASNWDAVTKSIYKSSKFGVELNKKAYLKDDIALLISKCKSQSEKIVCGLEYLKNKVKWNGYFGKTVDEGVRHAYKEGVGSAAEINLMLVSVLRQLGLKSNPVILSTRTNGIPILPTSDGLNYVIAAVELNEQVVLLDATEEYSTPNILPLRAINWQGRLIRESGSSTWVNLTPTQKASQDSNLQITLDSEGLIEGMNRVKYTNLKALTHRRKYAKLKEDDIIVKVEEDNGGIEIDEFRISNKKEAYKPLVFMYKFSSEDLVDVVGDKIYFKPLFFNSVTENPFKLEKREYPIDFDSPITYKNRVSITIPEGYSVESFPESLAVGLPNNYGVYQFKLSVTGNSINVFSQLDINTAIYPALNYAEIKEFFKMMVNKNTEQVVLKRN